MANELFWWSHLFNLDYMQDNHEKRRWWALVKGDSGVNRVVEPKRKGKRMSGGEAVFIHQDASSDNGGQEFLCLLENVTHTQDAF